MKTISILLLLLTMMGCQSLQKMQSCARICQRNVKFYQDDDTTCKCEGENYDTRAGY